MFNFAFQRTGTVFGTFTMNEKKKRNEEVARKSCLIKKNTFLHKNMNV